MRVVMISKALVVGAYQRKLEELARLPDIELTAIVPPAWRDRRGNVTLSRAHTAGYKLVVARVAFNGRYHLHFYPGLGRLLRDLRPDILHVDEEPYNLATWHALRMGQQIGARGLFFAWQNLQRRYPWPFHAFEKANYQRAAYAIAGSEAAATVLRAKGYRRSVAVIPQFGVDPEIFSPVEGDPRARPDSIAPSGTFAIGYAGGLVPEKGIDLLLRACADLPTRDWTLLLVGEGPDRARLERLAERLAITGRVLFLGRLPSVEMPRFYRSLDVLVLPSRTRPNWIEQFGRVLIEGMACRVPVIGSDSGEIPQVIGDAGLIFPRDDAAALRDAISSLIKDRAEAARLGERGRQRVMERYTQAQVAAATYRVYQEIDRRAGESATGSGVG